MKNLRLFKMLVVALVLQSTSQVISLPIYPDGKGECWSELKIQWDANKTKVLALKVLKYADEDLKNADELHKGFIIKSFNLDEVNLIANPSNKIMATMKSTLQQLKTNRKVQIGTALTILGLLAAYKNRDAIKTNAKKAKDYIASKEILKNGSEKVVKAVKCVGSTAVKPVDWLKNGYNWTKSKIPNFSKIRSTLPAPKPELINKTVDTAKQIVENTSKEIIPS